MTSCEDVAKMTRDLRNIPIKNGDRIRENEIQRSSSGILPSSTSGRLASVGSNGNSNAAIESKAESWVVAGVVGAKSKERMTANKAKFCQFQLCDLKSSVITVFMFGTVKERYHNRLRMGDVVAIMNPKVLKQAEVCPNCSSKKMDRIRLPVVRLFKLLILVIPLPYHLEAGPRNNWNADRTLRLYNDHWNQ